MPDPARTAEAFFQHYRAGCNAQTGDRYTVFATVFPKGDLEKELAEAAARMGDLRITAADLDREKPRLLDEVSNMFGRIPALGAVNIARELIRPTPRGGRKGGLPEHVQAITLDEVRAHWKRYYKPRNAILVLAGAVDEAAARRGGDGPLRQARARRGDPRTGRARFAEDRGGARAGQSNPSSRRPSPWPASPMPHPSPEVNSMRRSSCWWPGSTPLRPSPAVAGGTGRPSVYFPLLEDPAVLGVSVTAKAR